MSPGKDRFQTGDVRAYNYYRAFIGPVASNLGETLIMKKIVLTSMMLGFAVIAGMSRGAAQASVDLLQFLPDGNAVIVVDAQKVIASSTWTSLTSQDKFKGIIDKIIENVTELGVKLSDIRTAALVFQSSGWVDPTIAAEGTFNQTDLLARLRASSKVKLTSEKYKDHEVHIASRAQTNTDIAFVFYDAATVVAGSVAGVRASIDAKTGAKPSVARKTSLAGALAENPSAVIRFAMEKVPGLTDRPASAELPLPDFSSIKLVFGTVDLASGINLNATLRNDTIEHAKILADRLNAILGIGKAYLKGSSDPKMAALGNALSTVTVTGSEADVRVVGNLPPEVLALIFR
jgi:hypothetical protein